MSATAIATTTTSEPAEAGTGSSTTAEANSSLCRFFVRGICRFGELCRFSHDLSLLQGSDEIAAAVTQNSMATKVGATTETARPSTSRSWANAPVFIPKFRQQAAMDTKDADPNRTWAEVAGACVNSNLAGNAGLATNAAVLDGICPFIYDCPYGLACQYQHIELCEMCDSYCLHPTDMQQRRKHIQECLQQHERDMELSFAIARSKDKQCGICFDTIMEKSGREKRFGILPNCSHIFCLECIRKWRQAKQFEHKITRACPECRVASDFVCPSAFWVETKEEKEKLLVDYRNALGVKDCKYFKKGDGKCPFGNKCFYKHALPNGDLVDVGLPQRARKIHRNTDEIIDLLDIYLWEFVDQRDYHWLEMDSNPTDSIDSDWSDEE